MVFNTLLFNIESIARLFGSAMKPRKRYKQSHTSSPASPNTPSERRDPAQMVILDMLVDNEWRHLLLPLKSARKRVRRENHRGYLITPVTSEKEGTLTV